MTDQGNVDVLASLLDTHRLTTVVAGRIDLTPPWRLDSEPTDLLSILIQAAGESYLASGPGADPLVMRAGDIVIRPHGTSGTSIHDGTNPAVATWRLSVPTADRHPSPAPLRLARGTPASSFVSCLLRMGDAPRGPLLDSLPALIHIPARSGADHAQLRQVADMMIAESAAPGPASTRLMSRLAEILLILVFRQQARDLSGRPGLRALADPLIAPAIGRMHADPGRDWSVAALAGACGLSRSAFAARFTEAVGETPISYLIGWRMAAAAKLLATTGTTVGRVAASVGYRSEAAFRRAFTDALGCTPREYRKRHRPGIATGGVNGTGVGPTSVTSTSTTDGPRVATAAANAASKPSADVTRA